MPHQYRIRYSNGTGGKFTFDTHASHAITALNHFHRYMQTTLKVAPDAYNVVSLADYYNEDSTGFCRGRWIESKHDLPDTPNPDLEFGAKKPPSPETDVMPFMDSVEAGRLAD